PGHECRKKGDEGCAAESPLAQNKYHGIFASGGCAAAHTSNLAPALIALKAQVECVHPDGNRTMDAELLYDGGDLALRPGELIRAVKLAPSPMGRNSVYLEVRERQSFDFAIAAVAAAAHVEGGKVKEIRIVAGGVAPTPYRLRAVENALTGKKLDPNAAEFAAEGAKPLAQNAFKVPILKQLVRRALKELAQ
ncbi:MAG: FAD binding domain-containing protein, partial [Planctomycetota bacterium]